MSAPASAELQHALSELRHAAEALKIYDSAAADRLEALVHQHTPALGAETLTGEAAAQRDRIVSQGEQVIHAIALARQYPSQITARADVLDRAGTLAKMIRVMQGQH